MAVNFSTMVKLATQDMFAVPVTFHPVVSRPGAPSYGGRGIFNTGAVDIPLTDGSIFSDQRTILDIRNAEFSGALPMQGDRVTILVDCNDEPRGVYEITDADDDGGGQTTLALRVYGASLP